MNETKVIFKKKSEVEDFVIKTYNQAPHQFSFILEEESQNLYYKALLMDKGSVISDRQMRTLKSEIYRQITQDFGFRVVRDEHLAYYLFEEKSEKLFKKLSKYLKILSSLPDYFFDEALSLPLEEYISETDSVELINLGESLSVTKDLYNTLIENKIVSASTTEILVNYLKFNESDNIILFDSYFNRLPEILKESLRNANLTLLAFEENLNWSSQLDLYESLKSRNNLSTINFKDTIEEVRFLFEKIKEQPESTLVLYPKNSGYENLFYIYQREFFDSTKIQKKVKKSSKIREAVDQLNFASGDLDSYTYLRAISQNQNFTQELTKNLNRVNFYKKQVTSTKDKLINLHDYVDLLNSKIDLSEELDFISELELSLPTDLMLNEEDWSELILSSLSPISKDVKLSTELNIKKIEQSVNGSFSRVYFCGWSEDAFKPNLSSIISQKTLSLIEKDLGFSAWSVEKSVAKKVFLDPLFIDENVQVFFSTPKIDFSGKIVEKSVFNYLIEKKNKLDVLPPVRKNQIKINYEENRRIEDTSYKISASSLSQYDDCPFKFYMYKVLGVVQANEEDYFLDPMLEGSLIHELLEKFLTVKTSKEEFYLKVASLSKSGDTEFDVFKEPYILKIADRIWEILESEKAHLRDNNLKVFAIEKSFDFYADTKEKVFSKEKTNFRIRGKIDRIDKDSNDNILIYDYKRGISGISMFKNYNAQELKPQLFLYCLAAKEGFLGKFNDLVGFQYINTGEQKRSGGYIDKAFKGNGLIKEATSQSFLDEEVVNQKIELFLENFWLTLSSIESGDFEPNPKSHETCQKCEWKASCRKSETFL